VLQLELLDILLQPVELSEELLQEQLTLLLVEYVRRLLEVGEPFGGIQKRQNYIFDCGLSLLQGA